MDKIHDIARFQDYLRACGFLTVTREFGMRIFDRGDDGFVVKFDEDRYQGAEPPAHPEFDGRHLPEFRFRPCHIESGRFIATVTLGRWQSEFATDANWIRDFIGYRMPQMIKGLVGIAISDSMSGRPVYGDYYRAYALNVMMVRFKEAMDQESVSRIDNGGKKE